MSELIEGTIISVIYKNEENAYAVCRLNSILDNTIVVITGYLAAIQPGEFISCQGIWKNDKKYGLQFSVNSFEVKLPNDLDGIERYLGSGIIAGIGEAYAKRIVEKFAENSFNILDNSPDQLLEIDGIGKKKLERINTSWQAQQNAREVILFLQQYGISTLFSQKIFKEYGQNSVKIISENPYKLASDLIGVGFYKSDEIAKEMGIEMDSLLRIESAILYNLNKTIANGHSCFPLSKFKEETARILSLEPHLLDPVIAQLIQSKKIVIEILNNETGEPIAYIWNSYYHRLENEIVNYLKQFIQTESSINISNYSEDTLLEISKSEKIVLSKQQSETIKQAILEKVIIITGGPGTGKSTIVNFLLKIFNQYGYNITLAAPTGRASKRMSEITGQNASTLHSLFSIDMNVESFKNKNSKQVKTDILIIDEASMIDTFMFSTILESLDLKTKIILIGDVDQLPSIGPGNILKDLIESNLVKVSKLTEIYRQAQNSKIILNAHKINNGIYPDIDIDKEADFFFIQEKEPDRIASMIESLVSTRLKKTYNLNPLTDIQVLCPIHKSLIGTIEINQRLQNILNNHEDKTDKISRAGITFSAGDKVIQTKNNYEKNVFNGDIGIVKKINLIDKLLTVRMDRDRELEYDFSELNELELAYAVSVHKYQGSESPCVVIPIHESQFNMLYRNLLYTAITRGKKLVVLVGSKEALATAVNNFYNRERYSGLLHFVNKLSRFSFPEIKNIPMLGTLGYSEWVIDNNLQ
jgi:exodeoxyribonuclease V alpha subunit